MKPKIPTALRRGESHGTVSQSQGAGCNPQGRSTQPAAAATGSPAVLRPIRESDVEPIARWYTKAVVLAGSPAPLSDLLNSGGLLVFPEGADQQPVGLMLVALDDPEPGSATVNLLAIAAPEHRELAAQAVALFEADRHPESSRTRAAVPADVGLALYFWLRLGYRPIASHEELWMIRGLDA